MPLRSKHFAGNARLEACLVRDSAHVRRGDHGPYVLKIQQAVVNLSGKAIPIKELDEMRYGPGTAKAVLAYKRRNSVINFSYQTTADDIVGKMTIRSLDDGMLRFEARLNRKPRPIPGPHPRSPEETEPIGGMPRQDPGTLRHEPPDSRPAVGEATDGWEPPVSGWPDDLKATLERSNALRTKENNYLAPINPWGQDRKRLKELSRLLATSPDTAKILEIYNRMKPFGIWPHIAAIRKVYAGVGSRGFYFDPVNFDSFLRDMKFLTRPRTGWEAELYTARFCQDIGNVHGERDTFREIVGFGPGLHVCITRPIARGKDPCDVHVDAYQQGSAVVCGHCVPVTDAGTVAHVISVGPWLVDEALKKVDFNAEQNVKRYLRKVGAKVPGL